MYSGQPGCVPRSLNLPPPPLLPPSSLPPSNFRSEYFMRLRRARATSVVQQYEVRVSTVTQCCAILPWENGSVTCSPRAPYESERDCCCSLDLRSNCIERPPPPPPAPRASPQPSALDSWLKILLFVSKRIKVSTLIYLVTFIERSHFNVLIIDVPITWSGGRAWLPCVVAGQLQPRRTLPLDDDSARPRPYIWMKDGEVINTKRISQNGTLEVSRKGGGSEGVYQCAVAHHGGLVLGYPVHLKFSYMDKQFSSQSEDVKASVGQPLSIPCLIGSGPTASTTWTRNGVSLPTTHRYHVLESELLITNVRREDEGLYRCTATNTYLNRSRTSHEGLVSVEDSVASDPAFLRIRTENKIAVNRGSRVMLACPVLGWPRPQLIWELTPPGGSSIELKNREEVLILTKLEYDQEGVYTCLVEGRSELTKSFSVSITEPVRITLPPQSKEVMRASTVRFNCTAAGRPAPTVIWYKDGKKLPLAGRINLRKSADRSRIELVISGVTSHDAGNYQCFAQSGSSWSSWWARLEVSGSGAAAPAAVWCAPAGVASVALSWTPPNTTVLAYTVDTTSTDKDGVAMIGQPTNYTEDVVKVKEPLTPYVFQVRAYVKSDHNNRNVATDMSESVVCQGQGVPITLSKLEDDKVQVSWKQFADENPGVVQWILQYRHQNYTDDQHNVTLPAHVTNYTLAAPASSPLLVRLLGSRSFEWLKQNLTLVPWTSTTTAGRDHDDGEVTVIPQELEVSQVSERGFTVHWRCEHEAHYTYLVCVRAHGNDECQESYKTTATIEGLQPDTEYEVRVQVRVPGRALGGAFTAPYHVSTLPEGPHRFKDITYKFVNSTCLRVSWSGDPTRYTVRHSAQLKLPVEQWAAVHTVGNTVLITGIDPTEQTFVMVTGYDPLDYSPILNVPAQVKDLEAKDLKYVYTGSGVSVWWSGAGPRVVRFAQNITQPLETWSVVNVTDSRVELNVPDPSQPVFVMVTRAGGARRHHVLTIPPKPTSFFYYYLGLGVGGSLCVCLLIAALVIVWRVKTRRNRSVRTVTASGVEEEASEMRTIHQVARVANGGAGEPLLNGHVHITENPASKTTNMRSKKVRCAESPAYDAFDLSRHEADTTMETVLDDSRPYGLLDTSRPPDTDTYNKLPDDNMNCEPPTLQPNG
ncbi:unnamed protein product [Danaus chrysippus]|uniref:Hemolin n=1 Tax=Danaus chrysippus TaxID=151541 RepID=A0A8J2R442_9NEOP|nr:unnamed protein product [Danaus chrysippus]